MTKVAVIGAGLSGLVVAQRLGSVADVTVFEKSRGPGGRLSTRYAGDFEFDHGAQYFTARTHPFRSFLEPLIDEGTVARWHARIADFADGPPGRLEDSEHVEPRYVGAPRMNRIGKRLASGLNVSLETTITEIARLDGGWRLTDSDGRQHATFDWLVLAAPAAQTATLGAAFPALVAYCRERPMLGCFAVMLGFTERLNLEWQAARVRNADVAWIADNSSKPGRKELFTLVIHSSNGWAERHMEDDRDATLEHLLHAAESATGVKLDHAVHRQVHRWRYANANPRNGTDFFLDESSALAACGDWCLRGRVEDAFTSGYALASRIIACAE